MKNALLWSFGPDVQKTFVIFEFLLLQNFVQKWKSLNLGLKMPSLRVFGLDFEKGIVMFQMNTLMLF